MLSAVTGFPQLKINMVASPPVQRCFWQPWLNWGRGFRSAVACHFWDSPKRICSFKGLKKNALLSHNLLEIQILTKWPSSCPSPPQHSQSREQAVREVVAWAWLEGLGVVTECQLLHNCQVTLQESGRTQCESYIVRKFNRQSNRFGFCLLQMLQHGLL